MTPRDRFLQLLREDVLQLDLAELDFGIYRLLNHRRRQIEDFLSVELPAHIDSALAALPGEAGEDEQARIFNALYTFFNRYYDDGDFMPRARRGRDAAYSVPYNGEDVHFHWATKGSHYVKSGERFSGYAYTDGARRVTLGLRRADTEKDNVKGAKRCYVPAEFTVTEGGAALRFDYRPLDAQESKRYDPKKKAAAEAAAAAAPDDNGSGEPAEGKTPQDRLINAWLAGNDFAAAAVPAGLDIERLGKHVRRYVKGQTTDFFVHPQLGSFLRGELDYFLKHEFVNLWDLPDAALARERGKHRIVKDLGERIIDVLAALEDVQAILFEKRKFVIGCDWLIRASALAAQPGGQALLDQACGNAAQVAEWARWVGEAEPAGDITAAGRDLLARFPHLPVHTRHFDATLRGNLVTCFTDIEADAGGTLVHAENFAAIRTVTRALRDLVKCMYIDPPYNTVASEILYKNEFQQSSWLSLLRSRVLAARGLLSPTAPLIIAIDDFELIQLGSLLDDAFGSTHERDVVIVNHHPQGAGGTNVSRTHEYAFALSPRDTVTLRLPLKGDGVEEQSWPHSSEQRTGSDKWILCG
ncbi:MAG: DNA methyltransferase [Betaproteobacteria bacterium]